MAGQCLLSGQFTVNVVDGDGTEGTVGVSGVSVSGKVVTLGLASELAEGQTVSVDYAYDDQDDDHAPLRRAGGGDPVSGFSGQAVELDGDRRLLQRWENFSVSAEPGKLGLLATWEAVEGATSYKLRWRKSGEAFDAANAATVTEVISVVTVSDYGEWEVRASACSDAGCGPETSGTVDVVRDANLRLERAVDANGQIRPRTIHAKWDPVEGADSYTLRWRRLGADAPVQEQSQGQPGAVGRQPRAVSGVSAQGFNAQSENELTLPSDRTGVDITVPDDGAYEFDLQVQNDDDDLLAKDSGMLSERAGQTDTTAPRLVRGEMDGATITLWFSEPLDETAVGGHFGTSINIRDYIWTRGRTSNFEISGNKVTVRGNPRVKAVSTPRGYTAGVQYYPPTATGVSGIRDLAGNPVRSLTRYYYTYIDNVTGPPYVTGVAVSSDPGADGSYASGDAVNVKLTFQKAVNVTGTPRLKIDLDRAAGGERWADYAGGAGTKTLEFAYTVVDADFSTDGVAVLENTLELNGGAIQGVPPSPAENARLAHKGLRHNPAHKVVTPNSASPILQSANVDSTTLTLTFSEALGAAASLANDAFTVKKTPQGGSEQDVSLSGSPAISGASVTLTLASGVLATDTGVKVSYAKPTSGTNNKLVDAAGDEVADFTDEWVVNKLDVTKPTLERGEVESVGGEEVELTLYFSEPLDEHSWGTADYYRMTFVFDTGEIRFRLTQSSRRR